MARRSGLARASRLRWSGLSFAADGPVEAPRGPTRLEPARAPWTGPCPDLLHPTPRMGIDAHTLATQIAFAFAGGDAGERIRAILADVAPTETAWDPAVFSRHLFVDSWIEHLAARPLDGRPLEAEAASLRALLTRPPRDPEVRSFRREILAELAGSRARREELAELHRELKRLRLSLLRTPPESSEEGVRRRLGVLGVLRGVLERMATSFEGSRSGLAKLRELAAERLASESFARLVDLLEHDKRRATVEVHLRLGGDGRVRELTIAKVHEDARNRFHRTPLERLVAKLALVLRGYRFSDAELADRWIDVVYEGLAELLPGLFQLIPQMELYLAMLAFAEEARAKGLEVALPALEPSGAGALGGLFNPLLLAQGITPIACDLTLPGPGSTTVITGPNSGGKTRLLQSIGLAQLLAQGGLFVPARAARLREIPLLFCSLVQDESYDQSEGRLGTELLRIRRLFERAPPGSLVILDELCSGTNPSEGEEIFTLVISLLAELRPETFVTTHFLDFAQRLEARREELGLHFLRVELDAAQHPTYAFVPGVAPTSLAGQAASRLGVTREELRALVRRHDKR